MVNNSNDFKNMDIYISGCYLCFENYVIESFNYVIKFLIEYVWFG